MKLLQSEHYIFWVKNNDYYKEIKIL